VGSLPLSGLHGKRAALVMLLRPRQIGSDRSITGLAADSLNPALVTLTGHQAIRRGGQR